jgi:para-aminobenzoate synthetase/4-amino-4-deoxychorismate lyase
MDSAVGPSFSLLETMRLERGRILRLERHLARMAEAARHFEYAWSGAAVREALDALARDRREGCWRVRLLVSPDGRPTLECSPHVAEARVWRVELAPNPVDALDPFVLHKTTHRLVHDAARQSRPGADDVLLWNARGEITESTIANVVAELDRVRCTPPVSCGLLGGTFRAEQLEAGAIRERVLTKADVASASRLWLINSVREWIDAELV